MSFGENLRNLIDERNITQKELALQLNLSPSTVGSYVQNAREPDFETLKLIANYFSVSVDYLLDFSSSNIITKQERELLRIFKTLTSEQKEISIEQCKVFALYNYKKTK